jgi:drug/metabolite transporter (DMT)-like permease
MRSALFVAIVVLGDLIGNVLFRAGMRASPAPGVDPMAYLLVLLTPLVAGGILLQIVSLSAQLALLSWADLSYVIPMTSIGYALTALTASVVLHEPLSLPRCAAILFIMAGVTLVSRTKPISTGPTYIGDRK